MEGQFGSLLEIMQAIQVNLFETFAQEPNVSTPPSLSLLGLLLFLVLDVPHGAALDHLWGLIQSCSQNASMFAICESQLSQILASKSQIWQTL